MKNYPGNDTGCKNSSNNGGKIFDFCKNKGKYTWWACFHDRSLFLSSMFLVGNKNMKNTEMSEILHSSWLQEGKVLYGYYYTCG